MSKKLNETYPEELTNIFQKIGKFIRLKNGEPLYKEYSKSASICFVLSGAVQLEKTSRDGHKVSFGQVKAGQIFGQGSVFIDGMRIFDSFAAGETKILEISKEDTINLFITNKEFALLIVRELSQSVEINLKRIMSRVEYSPQERLVKVLSEKARKNRAIIRISQTSIAREVGLSRLKTHRMLKKMADIGILTLAYRQITIIDMKKLAKLEADIS
jgi:CRP/FNR family transcriptional regulator, cyclic AMP receptor protein